MSYFIRFLGQDVVNTKSVYKSVIKPMKKPYMKDPPLFGPFKKGDELHFSYNKTIGKNPPYIEDPEEDPIAYKRNVKTPVWYGPTYGRSTPMISVHTNYRNYNKEKVDLLKF